MSEVDDGGGAGHDHHGIVPALDLAGRIVDDLRDLQPLRWAVWQSLEDETGAQTGNHNWGLIHADLNGDSHTWTKTKKYYALAQFSKFIRPGARLVGCDTPDTIAAQDPRRKELIIVTRNAASSDQTIVYDLASAAPGDSVVEVYRTSAKEDLNKLANESMRHGRLTATVAAQSITTYVVKL
jgi:O-glycosyl hydrolase